MSTPANMIELPWVEVPEIERRFRRVLLIVVLVFLVLSVIMPFLPLPEVEKTQIVALPPRVAELILQRQQQPPPPPKVVQPEPEKKPEPKPKAEEKKPEPKPVEQPKPKPKEQPKKQTTQQAREKAATSGVLAFSDQLADLRDLSSVTKLKKSNRKLTQTTTQSTSSQQEQTTTRNVLTASRDAASTGSGGISTSSVSRDAGGSTQLQARATSQVAAPASTQGASRGSRASANQRTASRSEEEISDIIDKNKGSLFRIYNRALRKDPTLKGKLVLEITISPSGKVASVRVLSSELADSALERKLVARIKLIDFGAKEVGAVTTTLPIDFFPA